MQLIARIAIYILLGTVGALGLLVLYWWVTIFMDEVKKEIRQFYLYRGEDEKKK